MLFQTMNLLEEACAGDPQELPTCSANPATLQTALEILLGRILGSSPSDELTPARLLYLTQTLARVGSVTFSFENQLRQQLEGYEQQLVQARLWPTDLPLWWHPLPPPSSMARLHQSLGDHITAQLKQACASFERASIIIDMLPADFLAMLWQELETARQDDVLDFQREGTGAEGKISRHRWDEVTYLSGHEPKITARLPHLALLIQFFRYHLFEHLDLPLDCAPPNNAMLARYPAPSGGYNTHMDNPGGKNENGRTMTLVMYLNPSAYACSGGELAVWLDQGQEPQLRHRPIGGSAILFDARKTPHRVYPLEKGHHRQSLTFWFNNRLPQPMAFKPRPPKLSNAQLLVNRPSLPSLPENHLCFHFLNESGDSGSIEALKASSETARIGIVSTVYGAGASLDKWCDWHFGLGIQHIYLIFDHLSEEAENKIAQRLQKKWGDRITLACGETFLARQWPELERDQNSEDLYELAGTGSSAAAVCARQTLNASWALHHAKGRKNLDWLVHIDADELLHPASPGGPGSNLGQCFATASEAGYHLIRMINHEFMPGKPARFKMNPSLASARLGKQGWISTLQAMEIGRRGYYFNGYRNGKSAVSVAHARAAAGVHGWYLEKEANNHNTCYLAGPSVLHFHFSTPDRFCQKYLLIATRQAQGNQLFEASPVEEEALTLIQEAREQGLSDQELETRLKELHGQITRISQQDRVLMEASGLVFQSWLEHDLEDFNDSDTWG